MTTDCPDAGAEAYARLVREARELVRSAELLEDGKASVSLHLLNRVSEGIDLGRVVDELADAEADEDGAGDDPGEERGARARP